MRFNDLKAALQPNLDDDLGKVYAEFVRTSGTGDLVRFIQYLRDEGKVEKKVLEDLVSDGVIDAGAVEGLAKRNTPMPTPGRLHAPTLMPDFDEDDDDDDEDASEADSDSDIASPEIPPPPPPVPEPPAADSAGDVAAAEPEGSSEDPPTGDTQAPADADPDEVAASAMEERPKRRSEARGTGSRRAGRRTGSGRRSAGRGTGSTSKRGTDSGRKSTSARDRLKRTMFSLRAESEVTAETTDLLRRDYKFVGKVGEGAMGRVLKAKDNDLLRLVAYKEMSEEIASNPALASKFYAEAQITAQLDHPNIVPVYQLEQSTDGMLAYTMKLIKGDTVEDYIDTVKEAYQKHGKNRLPDDAQLDKRLEIFLRCCDALYYAHRRGVVHRDLKPENIMIGAYGEVYIMDWGIAKVVRDSDIVTEDAIELLYEPDEEADLIIGTPQYMSPEQANGDNADLDHRSDMYSMGLILYELISLNQAVTGKSAMKIVMRQQDGDRDPLQHAFGDKIPRALRAIMERATAKDKAKRYPHIMALADDIKHYLRDEPIVARPDSVPAAIGRWIRRHTALTAFGVLTLLFFAGVGVVTIGAGAAVYTAYASARQTKVNGLRSAVFAQASKIDGQFIKYEGLLGTVAATASEKLTLSAGGGVGYYTTARFDGEVEGETVPGLVESDRYGGTLSLEYPVFHATTDDPAAVRDMEKLSTMGGNLRAVLLRSESEEAARFTPARYKRRIAVQGTPLTWAFIGLESGAYVHYPGKPGLGGYDPREQSWYVETKKQSKREPGPQWSVPFPDYHGQGYVLTVSQPIYGVEDQLLGVTGVSITFDYLIDKYLELPENIKGVREITLLNADGKRVISTSDAGKSPSGGRTKEKRMPEFEVPAVVEAVKAFDQGGVTQATVDGEASLVFYNRMEGLGWYLVVVGTEAEMLSSEI